MRDAGKGSAVIELGDPSSGKKGLSMTGFKSWVAWRSAYLTRLGNMRNRLYVMVSTPVLTCRSLANSCYVAGQETDAACCC